MNLGRLGPCLSGVATALPSAPEWLHEHQGSHDKNRRGRMTDHILGVDISKANLDVHLIPTGETQQFANSTVGFRRLICLARSGAPGQPRGLLSRQDLGIGTSSGRLARPACPCHGSIRCRRGALRRHWGKRPRRTPSTPGSWQQWAGCLTCLARCHPRSSRLNSENCIRPGRR